MALADVTIDRLGGSVRRFRSMAEPRSPAVAEAIEAVVAR
jgi:hypothetical protein